MNNEEKILELLERMDERQNRFEERQTKTEQILGEMQSEQREMKKRQDRLEETINDTHKSVVLLENELVPKVNALFDAFSLNMDYSKQNHEPRIIKLEKSVDILQTDVTALKLKKAE